MSGGESESENEYEAIRQRNLLRKQALFAELGLDKIINEGKKIFAQTDEDRRERVRVRKNSVNDIPSRRSLRIQKLCKKVKYVKGFRGFDDEGVSTFEPSMTCETDEVESTENNNFSENIPVFPNECISEELHSKVGVDTTWRERNLQACLEIIKNSIEGPVELEELRLDDSDCEDDWGEYKQIMFHLSTSEESEESEDDGFSKKPRKLIKHLNSSSSSVPKLSCEEVTEELVSNIATRSSGKIYDQVNGTTCHQCRQKTLDTKSVCRSGRCIGVRGMFCGVCLLKRYGEKVEDALKNPLWECPVCRGICNCSFCRARAGKIPTGILYPIAKQQGYECVAEYLKEKEHGNEIANERRVSKMKVVATNDNTVT